MLRGSLDFPVASAPTWGHLGQALGLSEQGQWAEYGVGVHMPRGTHPAKSGQGQMQSREVFTKDPEFPTLSQQPSGVSRWNRPCCGWPCQLT